MWPWTRRDITPVGVEIDGSAVRLAQVEFRAGRPPLARLLARELPGKSQAQDDQARVSASIGLLRRMLAEGGFVGRRIVASLPESLVYLRTLRLAGEGPIDLDAAVRVEARTLFPFRPEQLQLHHIGAGRTRYGSESREEVIVTASPRAQVDRLLAEFDRAGANVAALDLGPCAAYRACRFLASDEREIHAVLQLGRLASHMLIGKGSQLRFIKRIAVGAAQLDQAVSRRLGIPNEDAAQIRRRLIRDNRDAPDRQAIRRTVVQACRPFLETLANEVSGCLRYYCVSFRGRAIERLLVGGRDAADPQLGAILSSALAVPVQIANPLAGIESEAGSVACEPHDWSTALGLATKFSIIPAAPLRADPRPGPISVVSSAVARG